MQSTMTCAGCQAAPSRTICPECGRSAEQPEFPTGEPAFRLHLSAADRLGVRPTPPAVFAPSVTMPLQTPGASNAYAATAEEVSAFETGKKFSLLKFVFVVAALIAFAYFGLPAIRHANGAHEASVGDCVQVAAAGAPATIVPCEQPHVGHVVSKVASPAQCVPQVQYAINYKGAQYCISNQP